MDEPEYKANQMHRVEKAVTAVILFINGYETAPNPERDAIRGPNICQVAAALHKSNERVGIFHEMLDHRT